MSKIYNQDLIGKKESVVDEILLLNPHQTPLLNALGFSEAVTQVEHVWFEDEMYADESTVNGGGTPVANTAITITVADAEPFRKDQVVKVGEELIYVNSVSGNDLSVTRGYADTTAAEIADGAVIEVQFVDSLEGRDARDARFKPRKRQSNLTQIFDDTVEVTGTAQAVTQYGVQDIYEYEKQKKQIELALQLEKALINGVKYENGNVRQMAGIRSLIKTNVIDATGSEKGIDEHVNDAAQKVYEKGGFASGGNFAIMVGAKQKRNFSSIDKADIRLTRGENTRGQVVDRFVTDFGEFDIVLNNNLAADELFLTDMNRMQVRPLSDRGFFHKYLGEKGDYEQGMLLGEYTLQFEQEKAHARVKGL